MTQPILTPLADPPDPTPDAILAARTEAGITQAEAAALVGLADRRGWWRVESGAAPLQPAMWAMFLLATGQHPTHKLTRK